MNRSKLQLALIVLFCLLTGFVIGLAVLEEDLGADFTTNKHAGYESLQLTFGLFGLIALPFALSHSSQEEAGSPGPRRALWGALVAIFAGGLSGFAVPACLVAMVSLFSRRSLLWSAAGVAALFVGTLVNALISPGMDFDDDLPAVSLGVATLTIFLLLIGMYRGRHRDQISARIFETRRQERDQIARDMHDSLSHRLSLIAVHAGALSYSASALPKELREAAETIREQSEAAVADLRAVLQTVRDAAPQDPRRSLKELVQEARAAGDDVDLSFEGGSSAEVLERLSTLSQHAVHRAIQEGLTNARKHAPGETVHIAVVDLGDRVRIRMHNKLLAKGSTGHAGYGLVGLAERASLTGGTLSVDQDNGEEFSWELELPLAQGVGK